MNDGTATKIMYNDLNYYTQNYIHKNDYTIKDENIHNSIFYINEHN